MKKSKKEPLTYFDKVTNQTYQVDSLEEIQFFDWCIELYDNGMIKTWTVDNSIYHSEVFSLSDSVKNPEKPTKTLLREHVYTPDFIIELTEKFYLTFPKNVFYPTTPDKKIYIDIKGSFNNFSGDRNFSINQKWVYQQHQIYINKIVPDKLFYKTFIPQAQQYTQKTKKFRQKYIGYLTLPEILNKTK